MTASIQRVSRKQACNAGWYRLPAWTVTKEDSPRRLYDLCPTCGPIALQVKQNRPETVKAERAARKAARIAAQAANERARLEKRAAKAAAALARAEAKASRVQERLAKRAARTAETTTHAATEPRPLDDVLSAAITEVLDPANQKTVDGIGNNPSPDNAREGKDPTVLDIIEGLLRARGGPLSVAEIVEQAAGTLPTLSRTPRTLVARDLAIDIKARGEASRFVRVAPGRFALRVVVESADGRGVTQ